MASTRMTVAEAVFFLVENFSPLDVIELDITTKVSVSVANEPKKTERIVSNNIFTANELDDPTDLEVDDLVYFDYTNPGNGPVERVGFVLKAERGKVLLEDLSVGGKPRWFDHDFIEDIYLLS